MDTSFVTRPDWLQKVVLSAMESPTKKTYSPVVRYTSLRFLVALAVRNGLQIDQMDAITAFMQGDLTEDIYLEQPEGFNDER